MKLFGTALERNLVTTRGATTNTHTEKLSSPPLEGRSRFFAAAPLVPHSAQYSIQNLFVTAFRIRSNAIIC
jgi:hypothetical protein